MVPLLQETADWLGATVNSDAEAEQRVQAGLPAATVQRFLDKGLTRSEVFSLVLPLRTWMHRKNRRQPLSVTESEHALRIARVLARASVVLGTRQAALAWARAPKERFEGRKPMTLLATEPGARMVEEMLVQIDEGMFA